jgi:hypothetical protein
VQSRARFCQLLLAFAFAYKHSSFLRSLFYQVCREWQAQVQVQVKPGCPIGSRSLIGNTVCDGPCSVAECCEKIKTPPCSSWFPSNQCPRGTHNLPDNTPCTSVLGRRVALSVAGAYCSQRDCCEKDADVEPVTCKELFFGGITRGCKFGFKAIPAAVCPGGDCSHDICCKLDVQTCAAWQADGNKCLPYTRFVDSLQPCVGNCNRKQCCKRVARPMCRAWGGKCPRGYDALPAATPCGLRPWQTGGVLLRHSSATAIKVPIIGTVMQSIEQKSSKEMLIAYASASTVDGILDVKAPLYGTYELQRQQIDFDKSFDAYEIKTATSMSTEVEILQFKELRFEATMLGYADIVPAVVQSNGCSYLDCCVERRDVTCGDMSEYQSWNCGINGVFNADAVCPKGACSFDICCDVVVPPTPGPRGSCKALFHSGADSRLKCFEGYEPHNNPFFLCAEATCTLKECCRPVAEIGFCNAGWMYSSSQIATPSTQTAMEMQQTTMAGQLPDKFGRKLLQFVRNRETTGELDENFSPTTPIMTLPPVDVLTRVCPKGFRALPLLPPFQCASAPCKWSECCEPIPAPATCRMQLFANNFKCPEGFLPLYNADCPDGSCSQDDCCLLDPNNTGGDTTCRSWFSTYECPASGVSFPAITVCDGECTREQCCGRPKRPFCESWFNSRCPRNKCPPETAPRPAWVQCQGEKCNSKDCCKLAEPSDATCDTQLFSQGFKCRGDNYTPLPDVVCVDGKCSHEMCCELNVNNENKLCRDWLMQGGNGEARPVADFRWRIPIPVSTGCPDNWTPQWNNVCVGDCGIKECCEQDTQRRTCAAFQLDKKCPIGGESLPLDTPCSGVPCSVDDCCLPPDTDKLTCQQVYFDENPGFCVGEGLTQLPDVPCPRGKCSVDDCCEKTTTGGHAFCRSFTGKCPYNTQRAPPKVPCAGAECTVDECCAPIRPQCGTWFEYRTASITVSQKDDGTKVVANARIETKPVNYCPLHTVAKPRDTFCWGDKCTSNDCCECARDADVTCKEALFDNEFICPRPLVTLPHVVCKGGKCTPDQCCSKGVHVNDGDGDSIESTWVDTKACSWWLLDNKCGQDEKPMTNNVCPVSRLNPLGGCDRKQCCEPDTLATKMAVGLFTPCKYWHHNNACEKNFEHKDSSTPCLSGGGFTYDKYQTGKGCSHDDCCAPIVLPVNTCKAFFDATKEPCPRGYTPLNFAKCPRGDCSVDRCCEKNDSTGGDNKFCRNWFLDKSIWGGNTCCPPSVARDFNTQCKGDCSHEECCTAPKQGVCKTWFGSGNKCNPRKQRSLPSYTQCAGVDCTSKDCCKDNDVDVPVVTCEVGFFANAPGMNAVCRPPNTPMNAAVCHGPCSYEQCCAKPEPSNQCRAALTASATGAPPLVVCPDNWVNKPFNTCEPSRPCDIKQCCEREMADNSLCVSFFEGSPYQNATRCGANLAPQPLYTPCQGTVCTEEECCKEKDPVDEDKTCEELFFAAGLSCPTSAWTPLPNAVCANRLGCGVAFCCEKPACGNGNNGNNGNGNGNGNNGNGNDGDDSGDLDGGNSCGNGDSGNNGDGDGDGGDGDGGGGGHCHYWHLANDCDKETAEPIYDALCNGNCSHEQCCKVTGGSTNGGGDGNDGELPSCGTYFDQQQGTCPPRHVALKDAMCPNGHCTDKTCCRPHAVCDEKDCDASIGFTMNDFRGSCRAPTCEQNGPECCKRATAVCKKSTCVAPFMPREGTLDKECLTINADTGECFENGASCCVEPSTRLDGDGNGDGNGDGGDNGEVDPDGDSDKDDAVVPTFKNFREALKFKVTASGAKTCSTAFATAGLECGAGKIKVSKPEFQSCGDDCTVNTCCQTETADALFCSSFAKECDALYTEVIENASTAPCDLFTGCDAVTCCLATQQRAMATLGLAEYEPLSTMTGGGDGVVDTNKPVDPGTKDPNTGDASTSEASSSDSGTIIAAVVVTGLIVAALGYLLHTKAMKKTRGRSGSSMHKDSISLNEFNRSSTNAKPTGPADNGTFAEADNDGYQNEHASNHSGSGSGSGSEVNDMTSDGSASD